MGSSEMRLNTDWFMTRLSTFPFIIHAGCEWPKYPYQEGNKGRINKMMHASQNIFISNM